MRVVYICVFVRYKTRFRGVCVCVCVRERERERESIRVYVCA